MDDGWVYAQHCGAAANGRLITLRIRMIRRGRKHLGSGVQNGPLLQTEGRRAGGQNLSPSEIWGLSK